MKQATFIARIACPHCHDETEWTGQQGTVQCLECLEPFAIPLAEYRLFAMRETWRQNPDGFVLERFAGPFESLDELNEFCRINDCFPGVETAHPIPSLTKHFRHQSTPRPSCSPSAWRKTWPP